MALKFVNGRLVVVPDDADIANQINQIYQEELGGNADAGGLQFYADLVKSGVPLDRIRAEIDDSPEGRVFDELKQTSGSRQTITDMGQASAFDLATQNIYGTDPYVEAVRTFQEEAYKPKTTTRPGTGTGSTSRADELAQYGYINNLYLDYLGRPASLAELQGYANEFGSSVDKDETQAFILGGVQSGEISQDRANSLLAALGIGGDDDGPGGDGPGGDGPGGGGPGGGGPGGGDRQSQIENLYQTTFYRPADPGSLEFYTTGEGKNYTIDELRQQFLESPEGLRVAQTAQLYTDYLGRPPDATGLRYWLNMFGETIDPNERYQFLLEAQKNNESLLEPGLEFLSTYVPGGREIPLSPYTDYRTIPAEETVGPFGGFFASEEDATVNPFDYTGIAPTPGMYRGYDPFANQRATEINSLANQYLGGNFEPEALEFYTTQRSTGRSLADIGADLRYGPEGQAFLQTGTPNEARAGVAPATPTFNPYVMRDLELQQFQTPEQSYFNASLPVNPYAPTNINPYGPLTPLTEFTYIPLTPPANVPLDGLEGGEDQGIVAAAPTTVPV